MLKIFKVSSIGTALLLLLMFFCLRLVQEWLGIPILQAEMHWLAAAQQMQQGEKLYSEIWDNMSPFSAVVYNFCFLLFGKKLLATHILAGVLVFVQAIIWNATLIRYKIFDERTILPALMYVVMACVFVDFAALSPQLLANTFVIIALDFMFLQFNENSSQKKVFEVGFYLGIATMFYVPYFVLLAVPILGFLLFTGVRGKDYLLMIFAYTIPIFCTWVYFFLQGRQTDFIEKALLSAFSLNQSDYTEFLVWLGIIGLACTYVIFSFLLLLQTSRFINYQVRCQQVLILLLVAGGISMFFHKPIYYHSFYVFLPAFSVFLAYFFLLIKNWVFREVLFVMLFCVSIGTSHLIQQRLLPKSLQTWLAYPKELFVSDLKDKKGLLNKKVWVVGEDFSAYQYGIATMPYLNAEMSEEYFQKIQQYRVLADVYTTFEQNKPQIIIDQRNLLPQLFKKVPVVASQYVFNKEKKWYELVNTEYKK